MSSKPLSNIIIGLGKTGFSCVRYLAAQGADFMVLDTREQPPCLAQLQQHYPDVRLQLGPLDRSLLSQAEQLIVSPGLAVNHPEIAAAVATGSRIVSDIDLFCDAISAPVVAITGSNAKSTVTTLVGLMAQCAGKRVAVGGNLGTPVLELLDQGEQQLYVLELSSFQLETTQRLHAEVATILNISADHLDRYDDLHAYQAAKQRIFKGCRNIVENADQPGLQGDVAGEPALWRYGLSLVAQQGTTDTHCFGVIAEGAELYLACGQNKLMPVAELKIKGRHNISNALSALALGAAAGLPMPAMLQALREFSGLAHRCQWITRLADVDFYNDSKGTNVGATVAALDGLGEVIDGRIVLIAGGEGKGADFAELAVPVQQYCRNVVLIGKDAERLAATLEPVFAPDHAAIVHAASMEEAVKRAAQLARAGDVVLLSPACASLDMFANFEARGDSFVATVQALGGQ